MNATLVRIVMERDNHQCQRCHKRTRPPLRYEYGIPSGEIRLQVHHLLPRSLSGKDEMENLVTLCGHCHSREHELGSELQRNRTALLRLRKHCAGPVWQWTFDS